MASNPEDPMSFAFVSGVQSCALNRWSPGIGDPTVIGWITVLVYAAAAYVAALVLRRVRFPQASRRRERMFWGLLAALLVALAINKQLDLQSYMTAIGRCIAKRQGWYDGRRVVQKDVILALLAAMLVSGFVTWRMMRGTLQRNALALIGIVFVLAFVGVRAVGFHHVDALINTHVLKMRINGLLELTGPVLIILCGLWLLGRLGAARGESRRGAA